MVRVQSLQRAPFPQHLLQHPSPASSHSHRVATHVSMYYFILNFDDFASNAYAITYLGVEGAVTLVLDWYHFFF